MADMAKSEEDNAPVAPGTIRNTPELRECIKDAMMKHGLKNATELCRFIKYDSPHTIERLLSGTLNFFPDMLSAIFAALEIDENKAPVSNSERMLLDVIPYKCGAIMTRPIPVYSLAHAASGFTVVDGCIQPIEKYWEGKVTKTTPVPIDGRDWAAFDVEGNSMYPKLMDGDIVLCDKCRPPVNGKIVVVCFKEDYKDYTGSCVIIVWHRIGDKTCHCSSCTQIILSDGNEFTSPVPKLFKNRDRISNRTGKTIKVPYYKSMPRARSQIQLGKNPLNSGTIQIFT